MSATLLEREAELEEARQVRDAARSEVQGLSTEVRRLRAEIAAKPAEEPPSESAELEALRQASAKAAEDLAESIKAQEELRVAKARLKKKVDTQELLYVSLRTELEAKKDRLRGQQELIERLQALEVSLGGGSARLEGSGSDFSELEADSAPESEREVSPAPEPEPETASASEPSGEPAPVTEPAPVSEPAPEPESAPGSEGASGSSA